jgi:CheY-like chemotaxis protein
MAVSSLLILIIDDEPPIVDILRRVGKKHFPEAVFISANSPHETLAYLEDSAQPQPDLILLDIDLHSVIDGLELLPQIRERTRMLTPVIMFSTSDTRPYITQAYTKGASAYTRKPYDLDGWVDYVKQLRGYWFSFSLLPGHP